jgi:DnaK suppressor protein
MMEGDVCKGCMDVPDRLGTGAFAASPRGHAGHVVKQRHHIPDSEINSARVVAHVRRVRCLGGQSQARFYRTPSGACFTPRNGGGRTPKIAEEPEVNQRQLKLFERLLMARRQELLDEAERTVGGMTDSKENFPDPTDRASLESNRNAMLRIRDRERKLINKIDDALKRIGDGSYGLCESCSGPIGMDRLKARPVTTLCIDCKSDQEAQERRQRGL